MQVGEKCRRVFGKCPVLLMFYEGYVKFCGTVKLPTIRLHTESVLGLLSDSAKDA